MRRQSLVVLAAAGAAMAATAPAMATWSILIVDTRTGEIALGSATCLTRLDLRELTPVLIAGNGGVTAQSAGDVTGRNRAFIKNRLVQGASLDEILTELSVSDPGHQTRQYGMIDITGETITFTGSQASNWAGGQTGRLGDLAWAVQGNILTGPNVVQDAVDAIVATEGDLAEKLMASMVAAREAGGDGRCSCSPGGPTGCGSPPPGEFKSADIGYMLVARLGDRDASRSLYFTPEQPGFPAATDLNADGRPDVVISTRTGSTLHTFVNTTSPGDTMSSVEPTGSFDTGRTGISGLVAARLTGNAADDLAFLSTGPDAINLMAGTGGGQFAAPLSTTLPGPGVNLALGATDATVAAVSIPSLDRVLVFDASPAGWALRADLGVAGTPTGVALADVDADGRDDLVITQSALGRVVVLRDAGDGSFEPYLDLPTGAGPVDVGVADFDADGRMDLVTANDQGRSISVLSQTGPAVFDRVDLPLLNRGFNVEIADITGDGLADVVSLSRAVNGIEAFVSRGSGGLENMGRNRAGSFQNAVVLADMNLDGLADIVSGQDQRGLTLMDSQGDGTFPPYSGFAAGDYFLALNVADTFSADPDPVDQMRAQFAGWRAGLEGRVDAVRSVVSAPSRVQAGEAFTVRVEARDWRGDLLAGDLPAGDLGAEVSLGTEPAGVTAVRNPEPGIVEIDLIAPADPSTMLLQIRVGRVDGAGGGLADAERLMPDTAVRALADLADFNADGRRDFADLLGFVTAFNAGDPAADLDRSGVLDQADLTLFAQRFVGP